LEKNMKNLVLGSALISSLALSSGCIFVTDDNNNVNQGSIGAAWNIKNNNQIVACPPGFNTARVVSHPHDRADSGGDKIDLFNCADTRGITAPLPAGAWDVWVDIVDQSGVNIYATSVPQFVDITTVDKDVSVDIHTDKGFYFFNWALQGKVSGGPLQCGQVNGLSKIALDASVTQGQLPQSTLFDCPQQAGYSLALTAGVYQLAIAGLDSGQGPVTDSTTVASAPIQAPNKINNLGTKMILVPAL
jgi:hypothetical protein